ncbi:MAG: hypothetical protein EP330_07355 [Deltaproteobacteria bacterium]|nr:MAG: hypothetical protein EP330_07355 [Deltaproteobacteria bacterium]
MSWARSPFVQFLGMMSRFVCWAPGTVEDVERRLQESNLAGVVSPGKFHLRHDVPGVRNSWRPSMQGTLHQAGDGVLVVVFITPNPAVMAFTALHAIPFLGISWLVGCAAFAAELGHATRALYDAVGGEFHGEDALDAHDLSDPRSAQAMDGAPWSFLPSSTLDEAEFTIRGTIVRGGTRIRVGRSLRYKIGNAPERTLAWGDLVRVHADGTALRLDLRDRSLVLRASHHTARDVAWLADFLDARLAERRVSEEERERAHRARSSLAQRV